MQRREFITLLGGAAITWPVIVHAQGSATVFRVGILNVGTVASTAHLVDAFVRGLNELGYIEGKNIIFERRYAGGQFAQLPLLAAELVNLKVHVILAGTPAAALAAAKATDTIPIVFTLVNDPVGEGFVSSLARPGGRMTGTTNVAVDLAGKRLEALQEAVRDLSRIGVLYVTAQLGVTAQLNEFRTAAGTLGAELLPIEASRLDEISVAFASMVKWKANAVAIIDNAYFFANRDQIVKLAAESKLPMACPTREWVQAGGLMSYAPNYPDLYRRAATYVHRILKGERPSELPVEQPTKFELAINLKATRALGLDIPPTLLARADEVIE